MKYLQIAALVVAGAVGGILLVKWNGGTTQTTQAPAPAAETAVPANPVVPETPAPAVQTPAPVEQTKGWQPAKARPKPSAMAARQPEPSRPQPAAKPETAQTTPPAASPSANQPEAAQLAQSPAPTVTAPPPPPPPRRVTVPAGTLVPVRTVEALSSDRNQPGDTFTATLDEPLVAEGFVIAERGAKLEGRVVESRRAGRVKGVSDLTVELTRLSTSDGQKVEIHTDSFEKQGTTSKGSDAAKVGAAAGIGAAIGAIAGGGKGAGIGAAIGGAAGTGGVLATRGKPAVVNSETRISFRLSQPITITEKRR